MDLGSIPALLSLGRNPSALGGAKEIAGTIVNRNPTNFHNCCAATLSCLLDFAGINVGVRPEVLDLAPHLEHDRRWSRIRIGDPIQDGDVGVFIASDGSDLHHIYLVIDSADQDSPLISDNQGAGSHRRPVAGGVMPGVSNVASPTTYFLRAS